MGKREVSTTTTRTVYICDLCQKDVGGYNLNRCEVCSREVGYCCGRLLLCYDSRHPGRIDLALRVCKSCDAAGKAVTGEPFIDSIRARVLECDARVSTLLQRWQAWAKEREQEREQEGQS